MTGKKTTAVFIVFYLLRSCEVGFSRCKTPVSVREPAPDPAIRQIGHRPRPWPAHRTASIVAAHCIAFAWPLDMRARPHNILQRFLSSAHYPIAGLTGTAGRRQ